MGRGKRLDPLEMNLYQIAENLHVPVYELRAHMPSSEFFGWMQFYRQREEARQEAQKPPSMLDDPSLMLKGFGL